MTALQKPRLVGYARVSNEDQVNDAQLIEPRAAGCHEIFEEYGFGASRTRPILARLFREILVVVRLDRLARSVSHLLLVIEQLEDKGAHFRSLHDRSIPRPRRSCFRCRFSALSPS